MVKKDLLTNHKKSPSFGLMMLSLLIFSLTFSKVYGQSNPPTQIACNDLIQLSLNDQCKAAVLPSIILEGEPANSDDLASGFKVRVSGITPTTPYSHPVITTPGNYSVTVTNVSGNSCWGNIIAEDKLAPVITNCPCVPGNQDPACAFRCTDEAAFFSNQINYPKPVVNENCGNFTTKFADDVIPSNICGQKIVRRTWQYTDGYGNISQTCVTEYRFNPVTIANVVQPTNNVALTCGAVTTPQGVFNYVRSNGGSVAQANAAAWPTVYGIPLQSQVCNLMVAFADTELPACAPACTNSKKVIRLWTILDWCNGATTTFPQVIKAADEKAPTITARSITVSVDPWACVANFSLPRPTVLTDNCDANPTYSVSGPVGVIIVLDPSTGQYVASGAPKGIHTFTYNAVDCCGNRSEVDIKVTVVDKTPPVAIAKQFIVLSLTTDDGNEGIAKLFTNSVDNGSYDSCTPVRLELRRETDPCGFPGNTTYNNDGHPNDNQGDTDGGSFVKFCCKDITNKTGPVPFGIVRVWMRVWDDGDGNGIYGSSGDNYNETWVEVRVEDKLVPKNACSKLLTSVAGKVVSHMGQNIADAEIVLDNGIPEMTTSAMSSSIGNYEFSEVSTEYDYSISGKKNDDYPNGVSTLDLILIQRHILDVEKLSSPYYVIAADVNNDAKVTASDLVELRKLILGVYATLPKSGSWKFIAAGQTFADSNRPWPINERIYIKDLNQQIKEQDFVGVKIGDVNGTATANANNPVIDQRSQIQLSTENIKLTAHRDHKINLSANTDRIYGAQFTMVLNNALLTDIYVGGSRLSDDNIVKVTENEYNISWNNLNPVSGSDFITLHVTPSRGTDLSSVLEVNSSLIAAEVYSGDDLQSGKLTFRFTDNEDNGSFEVFQNKPNPFQDKTTITFNLPEAGNATLKVFDITGQVIYSKTASFPKGLSTFTLSKTEFSSRGLLIYQIESGTSMTSRKMVVLE